jgi:hypothetical protein
MAQNEAGEVSSPILGVTLATVPDAPSIPVLVARSNGSTTLDLSSTGTTE